MSTEHKIHLTRFCEAFGIVTTGHKPKSLVFAEREGDILLSVTLWMYLDRPRLNVRMLNPHDYDHRGFSLFEREGRLYTDAPSKAELEAGWVRVVGDDWLDFCKQLMNLLPKEFYTAAMLKLFMQAAGHETYKDHFVLVDLAKPVVTPPKPLAGLIKRMLRRLRAHR